MNISDLIVIYLAFGAPFAVYKYLQSRRVSRGRKVLSSIATLVFWIPAAVRLAYRHLTNAYYKGGFVSQEDLDSRARRETELREALRLELLASGCKLSIHDVREVIDRYAGLAGLALDESESQGSVYGPFFEVGGLKDNEIGVACLTRRNRERVRRHHVQAREHFLSLFDHGNGSDFGKALLKGIDLARHVSDHEAAEQLEMLIDGRSTLWNPGQKHELAPATFSTAASPLQITATPLKGD